MFRGPEVHPHGVPLFWLELFDHSTKMSVDGFICHRPKTLFLYSTISSRRQLA